MPDKADPDLDFEEVLQLPLNLFAPPSLPAVEKNKTSPESKLPELPNTELVESGVNIADALQSDSLPNSDSSSNADSSSGLDLDTQKPEGEFSNLQESKSQLSAPNSDKPVSVTPDSRASSSELPDSTVAESSPNYFSLLQEKDSGGIEILVQMAHRGEIDPKNIDIIDATDRFLKAIAAAPRENLRRSGKIIFHASVLLRMKAEALLITRIEDLDIGGDDFMDFDTDGSPIIYDSNDEAVGRQITLADLQRALVRRSKQKQSRSRRVTLEQLIESLREAENLERKRIERKEREPKAVIQMDGYHDMEDMDDILDLAHDEDIEDVIARIEQLLVKTMERIMRLSLPKLIDMLEGRGDWVDAFLAVLFLSNAGKLNLEQEVFYGQLYLVKGAKDPLEATGTDGAVSASSASVVEPVAMAPLSEPPVPFTKPVRAKRAAKTVKRAKSEKSSTLPEIEESKLVLDESAGQELSPVDDDLIEKTEIELSPGVEPGIEI